MRKEQHHRQNFDSPHPEMSVLNQSERRNGRKDARANSIPLPPGNQIDNESRRHNGLSKAEKRADGA